MRAQPLKAFKIILSESKFLSVWCVHNYGVCTVHIQYIWQGNYQIYGHIRCVYTVLANPTYIPISMVLANSTRIASL